MRFHVEPPPPTRRSRARSRVICDEPACGFVSEWTSSTNAKRIKAEHEREHARKDEGR